MLLTAMSVAAQTADHLLLDTLLQQYVHEGRVDYAGWKARDMPKLDQYLDQLPRADRAAPTSREERLAFWINAYNACTIKGVLQRYPIDSIIGRILGVIPSPGFFHDKAYTPAGERMDLDHIEHGILRKEFAEPRIHFAIVCASVGCPYLRNRAFEAATLHETLDAAAREFMRNPEKVHVDRSSSTLHLSELFKWFAEDFERAAGSVPAYVARYLPEEDRPVVLGVGVSLRYLEWDWSLNNQ